jgi:hypothetical protein
LRCRQKSSRRPRAREGACEVRVREHAARFVGLVRAAHEHRIRVPAHEVDPIEVLHDRGHRQREHPLAPQRAGRGRRRGLELLVREFDAETAELFRQHAARLRRVVR